ncbi:adenosylcobinamide-phosphate synthase CbiB [Clostridium sp.]|uniref:adenosylcobinamide-phosphate synthase CbiB n=1 Tax=Clostridium sp. TaxID=1506 RepID=UPI001A480FB3|nr:adenosylcobinamide-phosphate synthase CbiB [Clostridium sp.]MBK5242892.1 cobalamin biosynthesis protein [Clostridium sp.]
MIDIGVAVLLDFLIGDPYWFPHPIIYIGKLIAFLENIFRKYCKSERMLKFSGGIIVIIVMCTSFLIPYFILYITRDLFWVHKILNILIIWTTLAARCLHKEGIKIYESLKTYDVQDARLKLSYIVGRDTKGLTEKEIIRADVETVAENTSDGVIAPLLFAMIGGAPLAMLYKGVNTMDSMLGYMNEKYKHIGFFPAKTDDVFNFIPARITGILICIVSPIVKGNIFRSFRIMMRDRKNHKSPNCGYPEAAVAAALGIQLGGTNTYFGESVIKPTMGDSINKLSMEHIKYTIMLMYLAEIICLAIYFIIFI